MAPPTVNRGPDPKRARVALTGATGFLGAHIARAACESGLELRAVVRDPSRLSAADAPCHEHARADLSDEAALRDAFAGVDVVIANAALGSRSGTLDDYVRINEQGVANTMRAAAAAGVRRVLLVSTVAVLPTSAFRTIPNNAPVRDQPNPLDWSRFTTDPRYTTTKTRGEKLARTVAAETGLELVVIRPGPVWGAGDTRFTSQMLRSLDRPVRFVPTAGVPLVYAADVAEACVQGAVRTHVSGRTYTIAGPPVALSAFARELGAAAGKRGVVVPVPVPLAVRYETTPAEQDLDFVNRPRELAILDCLTRLASA